MEVGDKIQCANDEDLIKTMNELAKEGIETDFDYSWEKPRLIVTAIDQKEMLAYTE